jgi:VRR-NUC domain.
VREAEEQIGFFRWIAANQARDPRLKTVFAIPNGGTRSVAEATRLKRGGVRPGVPDICVPIPIAPHASLWIEMKIKPNKLSDEQISFTNLLHSLGHCVRIAWSAQEAISILKRYLNGAE